MACTSCEEKTMNKAFPGPVIEITNPEKLVLFRKVVLPASLGDETMVPPTIGKYKNVLLEYEANGDLYLYSSDGIPTQLSADVDELRAQVESLSSSLSAEIGDREAADASLALLIGQLESKIPAEFSTAEWNNLWN